MVPSRGKTLLFLLLFLFICSSQLSAQKVAISGTVADTTGNAIAGATVISKVSGSGAVTAGDGSFSFQTDVTDEPVMLIFSCLGYLTDTLFLDQKNITTPLKVTLRNEVMLLRGVNVTAFREGDAGTIRIPVAAATVIPSLSGSIESTVKSLPGVASFNEMSSQYSVRGGSYDENLVYVNGIEVYKPYLVRSGQQEGLSQINPDLTGSVSFSPGGFSALYGDRMSSVLDIKYRKPERKEASLSPGMLTSSAHAGFISGNGKYFLLSGVRFRSNALLLRDMDVAGRYRPLFSDLQALAGYRIDERSELTLMLRGSLNRYIFMPESQTTTFGSVTTAYKLFAAFDGAEKDIYNNIDGALTYEIKHNPFFSGRLTVSAHLAQEAESFDIRGAYSLSSLDKTEMTQHYPDSILNIGIGSWLSHARNRLRSDVVTFNYRGSLSKGTNVTDWGLTARYRKYFMYINEWLRVDSAGYTTGSDEEDLTLTSFYFQEGTMTNYGGEAFINNKLSFNLFALRWIIEAGVRAGIDTYNNEFLLTPRGSLKVMLSTSTTAHISVGIYNQPPGGRELMRRIENAVYPLKAQRSYHAGAGLTYDFTAWDRPFRFTADIFGKKMDRVIPYTVDNVRLIYYGGNIAEGYSTGIDMRVNGEFVEGAESWFSLSLMKSAMRIPSLNSGWFSSPFDQRLNADIFFQDYLPGNPGFRAHINIVFGTGIPTSPPGSNPWEISFRMPPYRRIDIGFSKVLIGTVKGRRFGRDNSAFRELIAGVEILNLADIRNTISYTWIKSVENSDGVSIQYAVPNYLTNRSLNFRLTGRF